VLYGTREGNRVRVPNSAANRLRACTGTDAPSIRERYGGSEGSIDARSHGNRCFRNSRSWAGSCRTRHPIRAAMTASGRTVLCSADLQTFDEYFGAPGQVTLVLRPCASTTMQASVFRPPRPMDPSTPRIAI